MIVQSICLLIKVLEKVALLLMKNNTILKVYSSNISHLGKKTKEVNRLRNGFLTKFSTNGDIRKTVKLGRRVFEMHERIIFREKLL